MDEEVFDDSAMDHTDLALIGTSNLANIARNINPEAMENSGHYPTWVEDKQ
jgi:hypothetical protein